MCGLEGEHLILSLPTCMHPDLGEWKFLVYSSWHVAELGECSFRFSEMIFFWNQIQMSGGAEDHIEMNFSDIRA